MSIGKVNYENGARVMIVDLENYPKGDSTVELNDVGVVVGERVRTIRVKLARTDIIRNFLPHRIARVALTRKDIRFVYG